MKSQFGQLGKGLSFFFQSNSSMDREIHVMNDLVNLGHASWSDSVRNAHGAWIINWERNPYILSENMVVKEIFIEEIHHFNFKRIFIIQIHHKNFERNFCLTNSLLWFWKKFSVTNLKEFFFIRNKMLDKFYRKGKVGLVLIRSWHVFRSAWLNLFSIMCISWMPLFHCYLETTSSFLDVHFEIAWYHWYALLKYFLELLFALKGYIRRLCLLYMQLGGFSMEFAG